MYWSQHAGSSGSQTLVKVVGGWFFLPLGDLDLPSEELAPQDLRLSDRGTDPLRRTKGTGRTFHRSPSGHSSRALTTRRSPGTSEHGPETGPREYPTCPGVDVFTLLDLEGRVVVEESPQGPRRG